MAAAGGHVHLLLGSGWGMMCWRFLLGSDALLHVLLQPVPCPLPAGCLR